MAELKSIFLEGIDGIRAIAAEWDDLWERSDATLPTGRAELIAQWMEQFAARGRLVAVAVKDGNRLVAAIPLLGRRMKGFVTVGSLPRNDWCWAGDLLIDPSADAGVAEALIGGIRQCPWPLVWFDAVPFETPRWQRLLNAAQGAGLGYSIQERFRIGTVEIAELNSDRTAYEAAWSGNHRRHMRKALRRANARGGVFLDIRRPKTAEVEPLLREGFQVEHKSWKGRSGNSVAMNPAMWSFYVRQANQLAAYGALEFVFLRREGRAIAFEYGWRSKGVYFTPKVGFDENFADLSPGQLLRYLLIEQAFTRADRQSIDFLGPLSEATAKWSTNSYPIGRVAIHTGSRVGRAAIWGMERVLRHLGASSRHASDEAYPILEVPKSRRSPCPPGGRESKIGSPAEKADFSDRRTKTPIDAT